MTVTVEIPLATPNMTNRREHHMARSRRQKKQRDMTMLVLNASRWVKGLYAFDVMAMTGAPVRRLVVTLTRVSPGTLDAHDNLRSALKSVVDGVADYFRVDDADPRLEWRYAQAKGKAAVRIEFNVEATHEARP